MKPSRIDSLLPTVSYFAARIFRQMMDGTADIPRTKESEFYGAPGEQEASERMRALSPITHAANVKTPTLFVHGESDMRVPIEEAEQMYTALKKRHIPAKFIRYPGNYHGGWPVWDMVHRYYNELLWWNQYLQLCKDFIRSGVAR